ncbi:ankyrin repeat domain-containing protein 45-like isoform X1 [Haliotis rufescens]|uniref:ankyrin repeat domain-containing protein 45-like isoform X1 n=1 Tax=Haliotis rufescens TaxID=6454 RepID=UPI00201FB214|nr:ankyrin repeat domain-containing protein 45-like isoform X1 [Haliotis rufescens]
MTLEEAQTEEKQEEVLLPNTNIVTHCVYKNDVTRFVKCFEDDEDQFKETVSDFLNTRDEEGKSPLDVAATLGRIDMTRELLQRGADINNVTTKGYCPLHHAAAWGRIAVLKVLVEFSANLQQRNAHGERARETALRYNNSECVDYLDWAEARVQLVDTIKSIQETVTDPEKIQGKISKDEKNLAVNSCKEKNEWVEGTPDATTHDFIVQKQTLQEIVAPILQKIAEPRPEKDQGKGQKKSK